MLLNWLLIVSNILLVGATATYAVFTFRIVRQNEERRASEEQARLSERYNTHRLLSAGSRLAYGEYPVRFDDFVQRFGLDSEEFTAVAELTNLLHDYCGLLGRRVLVEGVEDLLEGAVVTHAGPVLGYALQQRGYVRNGVHLYRAHHGDHLENYIKDHHPEIYANVLDGLRQLGLTYRCVEGPEIPIDDEAIRKARGGLSPC